MYLTIKQHDAFRTLLMGFEIPFRKYIADCITTVYKTDDDFDNIMRTKNAQIPSTAPTFLKSTLNKACKDNTLKKAYAKFQTATSSVDEIVTEDIEIPMVGALNLATFALTEIFGDLYLLFGAYDEYCKLAEIYRYSRNKLEHPGSRTLEDAHLVPVLSFVKDICMFLDDSCFIQKKRETLISEVTALQKKRAPIPLEIHNFSEMPFGDSRIVCRDNEIQKIKLFAYGRPEDLRKQHSCCIYGYGGVGKTALVLEVLKQIVGDLQDGIAINDYSPTYFLFFSAKKRKLSLAAETGRFIEQPMRSHFETADELKGLLLSTLKVDSLRGFRDEGIVVIDNLETLPLEERKKVKEFVETQTPSEMQFILTSRNSEEYEQNFKLAGFDSNSGKNFIKTYCEENSLALSLTDEEEDQLLALAKGNTLVLVLSMRRLNRNNNSLISLQSEFNSGNSWNRLKSTLTNTPSNAYEVIAEFMYKDTFEHIESSFSGNTEVFYKILRVFAVSQNESTDISSICLLTDESYPNIEAAVDILCNYLILEKNDTQYSLNGFVEKYIISRFLPDSETYEHLSQEILTRKREVNRSLNKLQEDIKSRSALAKIIRDWLIISDVDKITAAEMYNTYGEVNKVCNHGGRFKIDATLEEFVSKCKKAERLTAHPFIKFQKARILQLIDHSNVTTEKHETSIRHGFSDAIYSIKTIEQYAGIQQTKSYASLLWLYGQYLYDKNDFAISMRYLEEGKSSFEEQGIVDQEYYQCITLLGSVYLDYYLEERTNRIAYLRRSRIISRKLSNDWSCLGKAKKYAKELKSRLSNYGQY